MALVANTTELGCWTDWSPCTVSCVPQGAAYFARQWRKQINCSSIEAYSLTHELRYINTSRDVTEAVAAEFRPCEYLLPICQRPPAFPSVRFNNLVYMRILVLSLASLFVLIPTLYVCVKYRRNAHPFVWLSSHAASLRDLTDRSDSAKVSSSSRRGAAPVKGRAAVDAAVVTPSVGILSTARAPATAAPTCSVETASKKATEERQPSKRSAQWSKLMATARERKEEAPPPAEATPPPQPKYPNSNLVPAEPKEPLQQERTQESASNDVAPQLEGALVKSHVGPGNSIDNHPEPIDKSIEHHERLAEQPTPDTVTR